MAPPTVQDSLAALEEAIELGDAADVGAAVTDLGLSLSQAPAGTEVQVLFSALVHEIAGVPLDRGQCAVLAHRMRTRLARAAEDDGSASTAAGPQPAPAPAPAATPDEEFVVVERAVDEHAEADRAPRWAVAADSVDVLRDFAVEARGLLDEAEQAFLALEAEAGGETSLESIAAAFRAFHTIKGVAGFLELDVLASTAHRTESLLAEVRDGVLPVAPCIDVVLRGVDLVRALIEHALRSAPYDLAVIGDYGRALDAAARGDGAESPRPPAPPPRAAAAPAPAAPAPSAAPAPVAAPAAPAVELRAAEPPVVPLKAAAEPKAAARRDDDGGTVKVDTHKMDGLVDLVGELAIAQAQLAADPVLTTITTPSLLRSISALTRVARELQRAALAMRMVAIKGTFDRMARVARDTARSLGKPINFVIEGAQTELDRTMVEAIYDPLVHLVRNAIDHGLEGAIERARRGKPSSGTITLRAYHHAGQVVVEIVDDGGGLDQARILDRAKNRGMIAPDAVLTADEIHHLIFMPGFSTAAQVTAVSGRGVGMDVVKTNIERVRGRVEIDSTQGHGTTIRLKLPLTLAIIDGLLIGVGPQRYVLPATWAREIFRPQPEQLSTVQGRGQMVKVRGTLYPVHRLSTLLGQLGGDGDGVMIMVDHGSRAVCLEVDRLLGKQEVVVKGLGAMFAGASGVAGGAILGDGRIALILDVPTLLGAPSGGERQVA